MEYNFRGHNGTKWVYGDLLNQFCGYEIAECNIYHKVDPQTIGEYIDNDKNGNPIFEGSIMEINSSLSGKELYFAIYDKPNHRYALKSSLQFGGVKAFSNNGKVVGNIFENSDLIEKQDYERNKNYNGYEQEPTCLSTQYTNRKVKQFMPR